ncbi:MAG: patatin-like phospholipase family protein [Bacteroidales bacterium]|nr:patatin-like phospholipase family protein [Bacteroidales bacterium]
MTTHSPKIGLALSGGGYRATAFHLGTLKKLNEMDILQKVDIISAISGGSIIGACFCSWEDDFNSFYDELYTGLQTKNVVKEVLLSWFGLRFLALTFVLIGAFYFLFTLHAWLFPIIITVLIVLLFKFQFRLFPISKRIEDIYDKFFYKKKTLEQLNKHPELVISATNLQTARPFTFSRYKMQDSTYEYLDDPVKFEVKGFPLARSVMASSCVPFAFAPVTIGKEFFEDEQEAKLYHPILIDGGVYDNQGIHKVMQKGQYACSIIITSDAGTGSSGERQYGNTITLLMETINIFMSRIKKAQMVRNVYDNASTFNKEVAYFSLGWDIENCILGFVKNLDKKQIAQAVIDAHQIKEEWIADPKNYASEIIAHLQERTGYNIINKPTEEEKKTARKVSTNLTALSKQKIDCLIKQAEALTELQVKLYCPSLLKPL